MKRERREKRRPLGMDAILMARISVAADTYRLAPCVEAHDRLCYAVGEYLNCVHPTSKSAIAWRRRFLP